MAVLLHLSRSWQTHLLVARQRAGLILQVASRGEEPHGCLHARSRLQRQERCCSPVRRSQARPLRCLCA